MSLSEFDEGWIVGFVESKGVFTKNTIRIKRKTKTGTKKYKYVNPVFYLVSKDKSALEIIKVRLGVGKIDQHGVVFHLGVRKKSEVLRLVEFLDGEFKSEIRTQQFERWKEQVLEWKSRARGKGTELNNQTTEFSKSF
jgi:hypothetical protein